MPQIKLIQEILQSAPNSVASFNGAAVSLDGAVNYAAQCALVVDTPSAKNFNSGAANVSDTATVADVGVKEVSNITCVGDTAGSLNSTYFNYETRNSGGGSVNLRYLWYSVDGTGVDPAPVGRTGIMAPIVTGDVDTAVAAATRTALAGDTKVSISGATSHCIITNNFMGTATDAANGTASPGFSYSITQGVASNLNNTYFTFSQTLDAVKYACWFNINNEGTAPVISGSPTLIVVTGIASITANNLAAAARTAIPLITSTPIAVTGATNHVILTNSTRGTCTATANGAGGASPSFTISNSPVGVNPGVNITTDTVTITANGLTTGLKGQLTTTGTLPAGLALTTDYYIISVDANTVGFASSYANALLGTKVDITDQGADNSVNTFTSTSLAGATVIVQKSNDPLGATPVNWTNEGSATSITQTANIWFEKANPEGNWIRLVFTITAGSFSTQNRITVKGPN